MSTPGLDPLGVLDGGGGDGGIFGAGGGAKGTPSATQAQEEFSRLLFGAAAPSINIAGGQLLELLSTGGVGAMIPSITQAVQAQRSAGSRARRQTEETLARQGITGTEAGRILSEQSLQAETQAAAIPSRFALPLQQQALQSILGLPQTAVGGLGQAGAVQQAEQQAQLQFITGLTQAAASAVPDVGIT